MRADERDSGHLLRMTAKSIELRNRVVDRRYLEEQSGPHPVDSAPGDRRSCHGSGVRGTGERVSAKSARIHGDVRQFGMV